MSAEGSINGGGRKPSRSELRRQVRSLARRFADELVDLLDESGFWDEPEPMSEQDPLNRRVRRSGAALEEVASRIEADLRARRQAVAISAIAEAMEMSARELTHPMNRLLEDGRIVRVGEKRGARYKIAPKRRTKRPPRKSRR